MKKKLICALLCGTLSVCGSTSIVLAGINYDDAAVIKRVQESLNEKGYDCGVPDGANGDRTRTAISNFRKDNSIASGDSIDDSLLYALGLIDESDTREVEFIPTTQEVKQALKNVQDDLLTELSKTITTMGIAEASVTDYGNAQNLGDIINIDVKITTDADKTLIASCMHVPYDTPAWDIRYIVDGENGHYYYLNEDYGDVEHLYDYQTGLLSAPIEPIKQTDNNTVSITFYSSVPNDTTGKWRLATVDTDIPVENYLLSYYNNYFKSDDEIHGIINTKDNTTTCVSVLAGMFSVTVHKYISGEENDAKILFSGEVISDEFYNMETGEIINF